MEHVCEHLRAVEDDLRAKHKVTFAGRPWSKNCRSWIYFDAVLDCDGLRKRFGLGPGITECVNDDPRSGREKGLFCETCKDAVVGIHPLDARR